MNAPASAAELCYDVPRLLQMFESLGENCDLGVVQRAVGLEPFGLFRFGACDAPGLAALLRARFHPLCEPEDLWLDEVGPRREFWVKSRHFPFESHTNRYAGRDDAEVARVGEIEKFRYLKLHLLRELARGKKLFVFKGKSDLATMHDMARELRTYGPNSLLWVALADDAHPAASVERDSDGLLLGFVSSFGTYDEDPILPVEEWVTVCAKAYRLWRNEEPPKVRIENLIARAVSAQSCRWVSDTHASTRTLNECSAIGGTVFEHRWHSGEPAYVYRAQLPIPSGGNYAFSAWIKVPEGFSAPRLCVRLAGFSSITTWMADPKTYTRWQRVWVCASVPNHARTIVCDLVVAGTAGGVFQSADWCLERGTRPSGYGFVLQ
jgi:hypothetical protein